MLENETPSRDGYTMLHSIHHRCGDGSTNVTSLNPAENMGLFENRVSPNPVVEHDVPR